MVVDFHMPATMIRAEVPGDVAGIFAVHAAAFPTEAEARLVDELRRNDRLTLSLVAVAGGAIVGHAAFSPVAVDGSPAGWGLAPIAVVPQHQRKGIGALLMEEGIKRARASGVGCLVVLGHPSYYPRFGFRRALGYGLQNEYGADDAFMVLELQPGGLPKPGVVRYSDEFRLFE